MTQDKFSDPSIVLFQGRAPLKAGEVELHALTDRLFGRNIDDVKNEWKKVSTQLQEMISSFTVNKPGGFSVDDITIKLGFSAEGKIAFIAEAGIEASVSVSFKRTTSAN